MSKPTWGLAVALLVAVSVLAMWSPPLHAQGKKTKSKFEPPDGKCIVVIGAAWDDEIRAYSLLTGDVPAGSKFFHQFDWGIDFFRHCVRDNGPLGGVAVVGINLLKPTHGSYTPYLRGEYDEKIRDLGEAMKNWGGPCYVAVGTEVDIDVVHDLKDDEHRLPRTPDEFIRVFRRVHRIWDEMGVKNVAYVWHSISDKIGPSSWQYWPGDEYVDWIGLSFYSGRQVEHAEALAQFARQHRKPLVVMESGPLGGEARAWDDWHGPFLQNCRRLGVKAICYNNWREPSVDRVFHNTAFDRLPKPITIAWGRAMKSPTYLHASPDLHEILEGRKEAIAQGPPKPEPITPAKGKLTNLLTKIDPKRDAVEGDWKLANKMLAFGGDKEWSRIPIPYQPPEEYDLTVVAERVRGTEILIIGLVVGGQQTTVVLDGWGGGVSGLERIDGKVSQDNETTHRGWRFVNGKPTTIVCKVRKSRVVVSVDGEEIVNWRGEPSRLSIVGGWNVPDDKQLFLGAWKGGAFRFRKVEIQEVSSNTGKGIK